MEFMSENYENPLVWLLVDFSSAQDMVPTGFIHSFLPSLPRVLRLIILSQDKDTAHMEEWKLIIKFSSTKQAKFTPRVYF